MWSGSRLGEKHWHGATPTTAVTHIAIQERLDGKVVDWMEQVTDEQVPAKELAPPPEKSKGARRSERPRVV